MSLPRSRESDATAHGWGPAPRTRSPLTTTDAFGPHHPAVAAQAEDL
jgi:hypothetical protein